MAKIVLPDASNGNSGTQRINDNFRKVAEALNDKVLFRDNPPGEPNEMNNDLDMNSNRVYNLPTPVLDHEATPWGEVKGGVPAAKEWAEKAKESALEAAESADESAASALVATEQAERAEQEADRAEAAADSISGEIGRIEDLEEAVDQIETDLLNKMDKNSLVLYADDFGAVGDGVANDQPALLAAITQAAGRPVLLTSGKTYRVNSQILYEGDVTIRTTGSGKATIYHAGQSFTPVYFRGTPVKTVNLNGDVQLGNSGWPVDDSTGITDEMLFEVKSSRSWYHDPRPESSDARKSELHKVQRVEGGIVYAQDKANDGYDLTAETVTLTFYSPIRVHVENITIQCVRPTPATTTASVTGLRIAYSVDARVIDVDADSTANTGILLEGSYRPLVDGGESRWCNNYFTGYGVHTYGTSYALIRNRKSASCRKCVDVSGGQIISLYTEVEGCTAQGGGVNSRGTAYGWTDAGILSDQQVGFATHGPADHTTFRNNTLVKLNYGFGVISRNVRIQDNYFIGRFGIPVAIQGGENYWVTGNTLYDGWTEQKNGSVLTGFADQRHMRPNTFISISPSWQGGLLVVTDNDVQIRTTFLAFAEGTKGCKATIARNRAQFEVPDNGTQSQLISSSVSETVADWEISDNYFYLKGVNAPATTLQNGNIILPVASKLVSGPSYSGTYTPTLTGAVNVASVTVSSLPWQYVRVGDIVQVYGSFSLTPNTAGTVSSILADIPIARAFPATGLGIGVASSQVGDSGYVQADTSGRIRILLTPLTTSQITVKITASYSL